MPVIVSTCMRLTTRVRRVRCSSSRRRNCSFLHRIRHLHVVDPHATVLLQILPAAGTAAVLMVRRQHLVARAQVDAGGHLVHALRRVAGDDYLAEIDSEEFGGAVTYFFCQVAESTPDIVVRVALQLVEIAEDSIGDDAWRGAHTARVEVYEPRVELEFLADALPVVGVTEGGVQVCAQRLQPVSYTLREFRPYLDAVAAASPLTNARRCICWSSFLSHPVYLQSASPATFPANGCGRREPTFVSTPRQPQYRNAVQPKERDRCVLPP